MECCLDSECCDGTESKRDDEAMLGCRNPATADGNCIKQHTSSHLSARTPHTGSIKITCLTKYFSDVSMKMVFCTDSASLSAAPAAHDLVHRLRELLPEAFDLERVRSLRRMNGYIQSKWRAE